MHISGHVCVSVSVRNMTSASSCWLIVNRCCCRYQPRFVSLSVCFCTRVRPCVCVCVCLCVRRWPQMHQHVCTLIRERDNALLCVEGAGKKPNRQGHSSSASSCPLAAPSLLTHRENGNRGDFHFKIEGEPSTCLILILLLRHAFIHNIHSGEGVYNICIQNRGKGWKQWETAAANDCWVKHVSDELHCTNKTLGNVYFFRQ